MSFADGDPLKQNLENGSRREVADETQLTALGLICRVGSTMS